MIIITRGPKCHRNIHLSEDSICQINLDNEHMPSPMQTSLSSRTRIVSLIGQWYLTVRSIQSNPM